MKKIVALLCSVVVFSLAAKAQAEQAIFNVPSADVLDSKVVYVETDWYFRPWDDGNGKAGSAYLRGMVGIGHNIELGLNSGALDLLHTSNPFLDLSAKWRPWQKEFSNNEKPGSIAWYLGTNNGVGLYDQVSGELRHLSYTAAALRVPGVQTRIEAGPYFATKYVFGERRFGGLATIEQPVPFVNGLTVAADWFSGDGASFTPGLIYAFKNLTAYAAYGLANTGRKDDLITLELGYTFK